MSMNWKKISAFLLLFVTILLLQYAFRWYIPSFSSDTGDIINEKPVEYNATALQPVDCLWNIIYARSAGGRGHFGNRLLEYASAWAFAEKQQLIAVVSDEIASVLGPSFEVLSVPSKSKYIEGIRGTNAHCASWLQQELEKCPMAKDTTDLEDLYMGQFWKTTPISIRPNAVLQHYITLFREELRQNLKPHSTLSAHVKETMLEVSRNMKKHPAEIVFVGVHVRLRDYPMFMRRKFGNDAQPVDVNYYLRATNYMINQLKNYASNIVFLILSDDEHWCLSNLIPSLEELVLGREWRRGKLAVRWSGSSSYRQDFALLSSCNHSIIAYGTYGVGAALLAGGMTVAYDMYRGKTGRYGTAMRFSDHIPEWTLLY